LLLSTFAEVVCAHTAGPGDTKPTATNSSATNFTPVFVCVIFMVRPRLD
jgi:hypothetical protein